MTSDFSNWFWIMVVATSIWVLIDAKAIGVRREERKSAFNFGPWGWFISCLFLWIIAFPAYIAKRAGFKKIATMPDNTQTQESTSDKANHQAKKSLGTFSIIIAIGFIAGIAWVLWQQVSFDVNGLPKCDSSLAENTAKEAMANSTTSKIIDLRIISFESVEYSKPVSASDTETSCNATVLTNAGKRQAHYTISKTADDNYYVQISLLPDQRNEESQ